MAVRVIIEKFQIGSCALCGKEDQRLSDTSGMDVCGLCKQDLYDCMDCSKCGVRLGFYCGQACKDVLCSECYSALSVSATDEKRKGKKRSKK